MIGGARRGCLPIMFWTGTITDHHSSKQEAFGHQQTDQSNEFVNLIGMSANENLPLIYCTIQSPTYLYGNYIEIYRFLNIRTSILDYPPEGFPWSARPFKHTESNLVKYTFQYTDGTCVSYCLQGFLVWPAVHIFKCLYPTVVRNLCPRLERFHYQLASCFPSTHPIASACLREREEARGFHNCWYPKMDGL